MHSCVYGHLQRNVWMIVSACRVGHGGDERFCMETVVKYDMKSMQSMSGLFFTSKP